MRQLTDSAESSRRAREIVACFPNANTETNRMGAF